MNRKKLIRLKPPPSRRRARLRRRPKTPQMPQKKRQKKLPRLPPLPKLRRIDLPLKLLLPKRSAKKMKLLS